MLPLLITACQPFWQEDVPVNPIPVIQIDSPASNARISVGEELEIKSTANDDAFVQRVELYVDGALIQKDLPPIATGQKTFTVLQRWLPTEAQAVELRVIAYDNQGAASHPAAIVLDVVGTPSSLVAVEPTTIAIPTETAATNSMPTAMVPESPPTNSITGAPTAESPVAPPPTPPIANLPTAAPAPTNNMPAAAAMPVVEGRLITTTSLEIYPAPDSQNEAIGSLNPNDVVIGIARHESGEWIKIVYGPSNREGWVLMEQFVWQGDIQALAVQ